MKYLVRVSSLLRTTYTNYNQEMLIVLASIAILIAANPHRRATLSTVQELPANVQGPNTGALRYIPSNLPANKLSFLNKYQPYSNAASAQISSKD